MKPNAAALAHIYANARYTLAQFAADNDAVRTGKLFGAKRDCVTLEAIFPKLADLSFSLNERTRAWEVIYGGDVLNEHTFVRPAAAVDYAKTLIRDRFEDLRLDAGSKGESPPGAVESTPPTPHDLPSGVVGRYRPDHYPLPPRRATCPHCGKTPLEK